MFSLFLHTTVFQCKGVYLLHLDSRISIFGDFQIHWPELFMVTISKYLHDLASNSTDVRINIVAETNYQTYGVLNFVANLIVIRTLDSLWPFYMKYIIYLCDNEKTLYWINAYMYIYLLISVRLWNFKDGGS